MSVRSHTRINMPKERQEKKHEIIIGEIISYFQKNKRNSHQKPSKSEGKNGRKFTCVERNPLQIIVCTPKETVVLVKVSSVKE